MNYGVEGTPFVLVVDDEVNFAKRLGYAFEEAGFHVAVEHDGEAALARIEQRAPDLIVLDVRMPRMNGIVCLRTLHARRDGSPTPVILLTGDTAPRVDAARLLYPGTYPLAKPCSYETVVGVAMRLLTHAV
jgi:DNA-binding response OmpR family regulator